MWLFYVLAALSLVALANFLAVVGGLAKIVVAGIFSRANNVDRAQGGWSVSQPTQVD